MTATQPQCAQMLADFNSRKKPAASPSPGKNQANKPASNASPAQAKGNEPKQGKNTPAKSAAKTSGGGSLPTNTAEEQLVSALRDMCEMSNSGAA